MILYNILIFVILNNQINKIEKRRKNSIFKVIFIIFDNYEK